LILGSRLDIVAWTTRGAIFPSWVASGTFEWKELTAITTRRQRARSDERIQPGVTGFSLASYAP
jgi:hypothetical protein